MSGCQIEYPSSPPEIQFDDENVPCYSYDSMNSDVSNFFQQLEGLVAKLGSKLEDPPTLLQGATDVYMVRSIDDWAQGDYCCKYQILNRWVNDLYELYSIYQTSKALWLALECIYKTDDFRMQKYSTTKFLNFKMLDLKPSMEQVEALQLIFQEIELEGKSIYNVFKTNVLIEKLPQGWSYFKKYLNLKCKAMSLDDLSRRHDVHVVEHNAKLKGKVKGIFISHKALMASSATNFKKINLERKFKGKCHHCGKIGDKAEVFKSEAKDIQSQPNLTEEDIVAVVNECNMVEDNPVDWYYETRATTHICSDKTMFTTYVKNKSNEQLSMANTTISARMISCWLRFLRIFSLT
ncbi:PREDICTED: uncharacterized protein LOC104768134 [Camelina sativa]|uniref:Uncharacterized protein LOC104768134 n=1 Tax=Camelina sativa TaxID=90675 RepID=A0ABM0XSH1_CAMSA|nr:PREDICTED: uncharacterized protein LOC104768134 [Camelina sativa]